MIPSPGLYLLHIGIAMEVSRILSAPLFLTCPLAGRSAIRLQTEQLVVGIPPMRPEPNITVTTLSESLRAHLLSSEKPGEEYNKHPQVVCLVIDALCLAALHRVLRKKKENDPFGLEKKKRKRTFQIG
jgi:hypothetical protein